VSMEAFLPFPPIIEILDDDNDNIPAHAAPIEIMDDDDDVIEIVDPSRRTAASRKRRRRDPESARPDESRPFEQSRIDEQLARSLQDEEDQSRHAMRSAAQGDHDDMHLPFHIHNGSVSGYAAPMQHPIPRFAAYLQQRFPWLNIGGDDDGFDTFPPHHAGPAPRGRNAALAHRQGDFTESDYDLLLQLDNNSKKKGASQSEINCLPSRVVKKGEEIESCVICICDMEVKQKIKPLPCSHSFHAGCISKWLKQNNCCPMCKAVVTAKPASGKRSA